MEWSRLQTGQIPYNPKLLNIRLLVIQVLRLVESAAAKKDIRITNQLDTDINLYADINMLYAILRNLMNNSIKFTPKRLAGRGLQPRPHRYPRAMWLQ